MIDYQELLTNLLGLVMAYAPKVLFALILLYFGLKIISRGMKLTDRIMKRNSFDEDLRPFIITLLSALFKILLLLSVAGIMGVETTSFVALLASIGFAIGFALQGSLSNMASGILILTFKPFRTGDMIRVDTYTGLVKEIQIFNTVLETLDHRRIVVPNKLLTDGVVENLSGAGVIRVDVIAGISYSGDIDEARDIVMQVIAGCPFAINDPDYQHQVNVRAMNSSSVDLEIWTWAKAEDYWNTFYFMQEYVKKAFDKYGVEIPFPQMDLHFKPASERSLIVEARQMSS
jgi:small conductance mechanosensitive channel